MLTLPLGCRMICPSPGEGDAMTHKRYKIRPAQLLLPEQRSGHFREMVIAFLAVVLTLVVVGGLLAS